MRSKPRQPVRFRPFCAEPMHRPHFSRPLGQRLFVILSPDRFRADGDMPSCVIACRFPIVSDRLGFVPRGTRRSNPGGCGPPASFLPFAGACMQEGRASAQVHPQTNPHGDSRLAGCNRHHLPHHARVGPGSGSGGSGRARHAGGDGGLAGGQRAGRSHLAAVRQLRRRRGPRRPRHVVLHPSAGHPGDRGALPRHGGVSPSAPSSWRPSWASPWACWRP